MSDITTNLIGQWAAKAGSVMIGTAVGYIGSVQMSEDASFLLKILPMAVMGITFGIFGQIIARDMRARDLREVPVFAGPVPVVVVDPPVPGVRETPL